MAHIGIGDFMSGGSGESYVSDRVTFTRGEGYRIWYQFGEFNETRIRSWVMCRTSVWNVYAFPIEIVHLARLDLVRNERYTFTLPFDDSYVDDGTFELRVDRMSNWTGGHDTESVRIRMFYEDVPFPV